MKRMVRSPFFYAAVAGTGLVAGSIFAIVSSTQAANYSFERLGFDEMVSALSKEAKVSEKTLSESLETNKLIVSVSDISELDEDETIVDYHETLADHYIVEYASAEDAAKAYKKLSDSEDDSALLNRKVETTRFDFYCDDESDPTDCMGWGTSTMKLDDYADSLEGSSKRVTVAVLDSGINKDLFLFSENSQYDRLDLSSSLVHDYGNNDADPSDAGGHGTMVSAVIAQSTPSNVKIIPVKVFSDDGSNDTFDHTLDALAAVKGKVDIINLSLGIIEDDDNKLSASDIAYINNAMQEVKDAGSIVIAAAGNESNSAIAYPAASPSVIAITSVDKNNNFSSSFSNYGSAADFSAPGDELILPVADNEWYGTSGTSFSSPYVAAAVANMLTEHSWSYDQVYANLKLNAEDIGNDGWDQYYGWGSVSFHVNKYADLNIGTINIPDQWTNQNVTISLNPSSTAYQITKKYFGTGTITETPAYDAWTSVSGSTMSQTISSNGTYTIWFKNSNNETASKTFTISKIDKDAPSITTGLAAGSITTSGATLSISVNDSASGLAKIIWYYKESDASEYTQIVDDYTGVTPAATTKTHALTGLTAGSTYSAYAEIYDIAGNKTTSGAISFTVTAEGGDTGGDNGGDNGGNTGGDDGGDTGGDNGGDNGGNTGGDDGGDTGGDNGGDNGDNESGTNNNGDPIDLPNDGDITNPKTGDNNIGLVSVATGIFALTGAAVAIRRRR